MPADDDSSPGHAVGDVAHGSDSPSCWRCGKSPVDSVAQCPDCKAWQGNWKILTRLEDFFKSIEGIMVACGAAIAAAWLVYDQVNPNEWWPGNFVASNVDIKSCNWNDVTFTLENGGNKPVVLEGISIALRYNTPNNNKDITYRMLTEDDVSIMVKGIPYRLSNYIGSVNLNKGIAPSTRSPNIYRLVWDANGQDMISFDDECKASGRICEVHIKVDVPRRIWRNPRGGFDCGAQKPIDYRDD